LENFVVIHSKFPTYIYRSSKPRDNNEFMQRIFIMADIRSEKTPLARLMLFMICISVAGSIGAGISWFAVELPAQNAVTAPANGDTLACGNARQECTNGCGNMPYHNDAEITARNTCYRQCGETSRRCVQCVEYGVGC
jgi:hypothetical protein